MNEEEFRAKLEQQLEEDGVCPLCGRIDNVVRAVTTVMKQGMVVHKPGDFAFREEV